MDFLDVDASVDKDERERLRGIFLRLSGSEPVGGAMGSIVELVVDWGELL